MPISFASLSGGGGGGTEKVEVFNSTGTWTAPQNTNYAVAHLVAGGGGGGGADSNATGSRGGSSSFGSFSLSGGVGGPSTTSVGPNMQAGRQSGAASTGQGASGISAYSNNAGWMGASSAGSSNTKIVGQEVIPGQSYTVTVGGGGAGAFGNYGTGGSGGSGYVSVVYSE